MQRRLPSNGLVDFLPFLVGTFIDVQIELVVARVGSVASVVPVDFVSSRVNVTVASLNDIGASVNGIRSSTTTSHANGQRTCAKRVPWISIDTQGECVCASVQDIVFTNSASTVTPCMDLVLATCSVATTANDVLNGGKKVAIVEIRASKEGTMSYKDRMMQT